MRAAFGIQAFFDQAQALNWFSAHQMLRDNGFGIFRRDMAIPDSFRINHDHRSMLALVEASGLVDSHACAQPRGFAQQLQLGMKITLSILGAGCSGRSGGTLIMTNEDMAFERGQGEFSSMGISFRLNCDPVSALFRREVFTFAGKPPACR